MALISIFANSILPIFIVAGIGFLLARYLHVDVKALSLVTFNVLTPCLVFYILVTAQLSPGEFGRMAAFSACLIVGAGLLAWLTSLGLRLDRPMTSAFVSVAMFANAGNYGLPLVLFAFGQEALTRATVYFVIHVVLLYSVGIIVASSSQGNLRQVIRSVIRVPHLYAILAALVFIVTRVTVPTPVMRPIALLNNAALPMMVLLLGMQLERAALPKRLGLVGLATAGRLIVLPLLALGLAAIFGLTGADRQAAVIQASMPAAVMVTVLAVEFQTEPAFVTAVVFLSTVLSPLTLTPLIAFLQH
jgi:predicted permease